MLIHFYFHQLFIYIYIYILLRLSFNSSLSEYNHERFFHMYSTTRDKNTRAHARNYIDILATENESAEPYNSNET